MEWIIGNMGTIVVGGVVLVAIYFALKSVIKTSKSGGCSGCSGCSGSSCHCNKMEL